MPASQQAKLLRVLEDGVVTPVGATEPLAVSPRIVAATNADLAAAVNEGRFREDMLDRLNVLPVEMPSLRERPEDLPHLAEHFLALANEEEGAMVGPITVAALRSIRDSLDEINVRRLRHIIRRIVIVKRQGAIEPDDLAEAGMSRSVGGGTPAASALTRAILGS